MEGGDGAPPGLASAAETSSPPGFVLVGEVSDEAASTAAPPRSGATRPPGAPSTEERRAPTSVPAERESRTQTMATAGTNQLSSPGDGSQSKKGGADLGDLLANAPRDVAEGTIGGLKSIAMGVGAGVAGLVAMPVLGATQEGVPGFFKGLGAGVLGAVVLPVAGAVKGVTEIVGGVINTPQAISSTAQGMVWDPIQKKWTRYNLNEEAQRVLAAEWQEEEEQHRQDASRGRRLGGGRTEVRDMAYYDLLGVTPDTSPEEIKKAYYKAARKVHPDKNPGDAEAHKKFQALSQAYQVLSNDQLRAAYDRDGAEGVASEGVNFIDPTIFFNMLFGSEKFEPYVGKLKLAHVASAVGDMVKNPEKGGDESGGGGLSEVTGQGERALRIQNTREVRCALHLVTLVEPYVRGEQEAFRGWCIKEAEELAKGAFGPTMLVAVGWAYENQSQEYLGYYNSFLGVDALVARTARTGNLIMKQADMAGATIGALKAARDLSDNMPSNSKAAASGGGSASSPSSPGDGAAMGGMSPEDMAKAQQALNDSIPVFVNAMWKVSALDIQETVSHVCNKVLKDRAVSKEERKRRAEAIGILGAAFRRTGEAHLAKGGQLDTRREVETALQKTMAVAHGQEL